MDNNTKWEELRRVARKLENEISSKLAAYSKFSSSYAKSALLKDSNSNNHSEKDIESAPLIDEQHNTLSLEIDNLLARLSEINDELNGCIDGMGNNANPQIMMNLQRHREILQEYSQEFKKTKSTITSYREHAELLTSVRKDISNYKNDSQTDLFFRQSISTRNSNAELDGTVGNAVAVYEELQKQREDLFSRTWGRLKTVGGKLPTVNGVIQKISRKKSRDTIIIALIIAVACILLFLYWAQWS